MWGFEAAAPLMAATRAVGDVRVGGRRGGRPRPAPRPGLRGAARARGWPASTTSTATRAAEVAGAARRAGSSSTSRDLLDEVDAVSVAVPTVDHHRVARVLLEAGKDVLVEKPMTTTARGGGGPHSRSPARGGRSSRSATSSGSTRPWTSCRRTVVAAAVHRGAPAGLVLPRSLDIDVVLDLMIHDLDIVLTLDGSEAVQVDAVGVPVLTPRVDIANVRLRFASGLIANLTASRVSAEKVRKFRVFSPRTYISVDFAAPRGPGLPPHGRGGRARRSRSSRRRRRTRSRSAGSSPRSSSARDHAARRWSAARTGSASCAWRT